MTLPASQSLTGSYHYLSSQQGHYSHNRAPSAHHFPSLLYPYDMHSPKELKDTVEPHPHYSSVHSPPPPPKMLNHPPPQGPQSERCLQIPSIRSENQREMPAIPESHSNGSSPSRHKISKPKIVFSYFPTSNDNHPRATSNSCGSKSQENHQRIYIGEFQLSMLKYFKKENLKICSNELNHAIPPRNLTRSIKKTSSVSRDKYFRTAQPIKKMFRTSGTGFPIAHEEVKKGKESKMASTQATRSFRTEGEASDPRSSNINKEATFDFSSIKSLEGKPSAFREKSSLMKNTMTFSKYDFGGVICQEARSSRKDLDPLYPEQQQRWKSYVKGLFEEDQNLKQSIHCGPEVRGDNMRVDVLTGFGREILESCIPESESFQ